MGERPEITLNMICAVTEDTGNGRCAYVIQYDGIDYDIFDSLCGDLIDKCLLYPDDIVAGIYFCDNFRVVNKEYDRDGNCDYYEIKCDWKQMMVIDEKVLGNIRNQKVVIPN